MASSLDVVCIGHATLDLVTRLDGPPPDDARVLASAAVLSGGGPAATAAVALARLGMSVALLGTVGDDAAGDFVIGGLAREGVDVAGVRRTASSTALSSIWVDARSGHRSIAAFYREAGIEDISERDLELARSAAWIHVDSPGHRAIAPLRREGVTTPISLDAGNPVADLDLARIDLYAPTEARLLERHGASPAEAIQTVLASGPRLVVATRGDRGSIGAQRLPDGSTDVVEAPAFDVPVVSTLGAGDVFHGALLAALVRGLDLAEALTFANAVAALACRALDGRSALPSWDEARAFVAASGRSLDRTPATAAAAAAAPARRA